MRLGVVTAAALALAGCAASSGEKAEQQFNMIADGGTDREKCDAATRVEAAYLADGDAARFRDWRIKAGLACNQADLDAAGG
jgi:hypothetical protein